MSGPLTICHVTDFLPGSHKIAGGAEYAVASILRRQAGLGVNLHAVTLRPDFEPTAMGATRHAMASLDRTVGGPLFAVKQFFIPVDPLAMRSLARTLRRLQPDLVHFHNLHFASMWAVRTARRLGFRTVWSVYDYWLFCPSFMLLRSDGTLCEQGHGARCVDCIGIDRMRALKPLKRALFGLRPALVRPAIDAADRFIALSEASRSLLAAHGIARSRIDVVPLYPWAEALAHVPARPAVPGRLIYAGWIEGRKGLHVVIEALGRLRASHPDVHLHVLGLPADHEYQAAIDARIEALGIRDRVVFRGAVSRDQLLQAFDEAFLVVVPEQWENMSPVIMCEAMSAGKCVLASHVGGVPDFLDRGAAGLLADRDRPDSWAERIAWAWLHPDAVASLGAAARRRATQVFDAQAIDESFLSIYRAMCAAPAGSPAGGVAPLPRRDGRQR
jgi:glycosyltransferase involved in cell wall biosynthesis